jgi:hypothetical protein
MATLELTWTTFDIVVYGGKRVGRSIDFIIDGTSLATRLRCLPVTRFGDLGGNEKFARQAVREMLFEEPAAMNDGSLALYLSCNVCADFDCGVTSAIMSRVDDTVVWSSFTEKSLNTDDPDAYWYETPLDIEPLAFDWDRYKKTIGVDLPTMLAEFYGR